MKGETRRSIIARSSKQSVSSPLPKAGFDIYTCIYTKKQTTIVVRCAGSLYSISITVQVYVINKRAYINQCNKKCFTRLLSRFKCHERLNATQNRWQIAVGDILGTRYRIAVSFCHTTTFTCIGFAQDTYSVFDVSNYLYVFRVQFIPAVTVVQHNKTGEKLIDRH